MTDAIADDLRKARALVEKGWSTVATPEQTCPLCGGMGRV